MPDGRGHRGVQQQPQATGRRCRCDRGGRRRHRARLQCRQRLPLRQGAGGLRPARAQHRCPPCLRRLPHRQAQAVRRHRPCARGRPRGLRQHHPQGPQHHRLLQPRQPPPRPALRPLGQPPIRRLRAQQEETETAHPRRQRRCQRRGRPAGDGPADATTSPSHRRGHHLLRRRGLRHPHLLPWRLQGRHLVPRLAILGPRAPRAGLQRPLRHPAGHGADGVPPSTAKASRNAPPPRRSRKSGTPPNAWASAATSPRKTAWR